MGSIVRFCFELPTRPRDVLPHTRRDTVYLHTTPADSDGQRAHLQAFEEHVGLLMKAALTKYPYGAEPQDVAQDIFLAFMKARQSFDPTKNAQFCTYAHRAVEHQMIDLTYFETNRQRDRPGYTLHNESSLGTRVEDDDELWPFEWIAGCEESGYGQAEYADVRRFVSSLPPRQRAVVELVFWQGLSPAEAARELGITRGAVNALLNKVYDKGRKNLCAYASSSETDHLGA